MRTSLFVPALFAVALVGSSALAERPNRSVPDRLRARGDVVEKSYRNAPERGAKAAPQAPQQASRGRAFLDRGGSRVSCSDAGVDCAAQRGASGRAAALESSGASAAGGRGARIPSFMQRFLGSDRTAMNEAGEDQGMSLRAAKRAWANAGRTVSGDEKGAADRGAEAAARGAASQKAQVGVPSGGNRMACNDAGECMMSSKAAKKEWSYQAVRAGTWNGPDVKSATPADRAIAEMKKAQSKANQEKR